MVTTNFTIRLMSSLLEYIELAVVILLVYKLIKLVTVGTSKVSNIKKNKKENKKDKKTSKSNNNERKTLEEVISGEEKPKESEPESILEKNNPDNNNSTSESNFMPLRPIIKLIVDLNNYINSFEKITKQFLPENQESETHANIISKEAWKKILELNKIISKQVKNINQLIKNNFPKKVTNQKDDILKTIKEFITLQIKYSQICSKIANSPNSFKEEDKDKLVSLIKNSLENLSSTLTNLTEISIEKRAWNEPLKDLNNNLRTLLNKNYSLSKEEKKKLLSEYNDKLKELMAYKQQISHYKEEVDTKTKEIIEKKEKVTNLFTEKDKLYWFDEDKIETVEKLEEAIKENEELITQLNNLSDDSFKEIISIIQEEIDSYKYLVNLCEDRSVNREKLIKLEKQLEEYNGVSKRNFDLLKESLEKYKEKNLKKYKQN